MSAYFDTPVPEFRLYVADLAEPEVALPGEGPRIVLCTAGTAALRGGHDQIKLARGESCFVPAADGPLRAAGPGRLFLAAPGPAEPLCDSGWLVPARSAKLRGRGGLPPRWGMG